jgi:hypothetical protein
MTVERWKEIGRLGIASEDVRELRGLLKECLEEIDDYRRANRTLSRGVQALYGRLESVKAGRGDPHG